MKSGSRLGLILAWILCVFWGVLLLRLSGKHKIKPPELPQGELNPFHVRFEDVAERSGLNYAFTIAGRRPLTILQSIGNGCAFLDYDNDGNLDILLVGNPMPKLFRGDGKGHFTEMGAQLGFLPRCPAGGQWLGCAVGDYDNDGFVDIYLSGYRCGALWHNIGGKRFHDVTQTAGLRPQRWGTSCAFADLDGDGKLDLIVANYLKFSRDPKISPQLCTTPGGIQLGCMPLTYPPEKPVFYRNLGNGRFQDETESHGLRFAAGKGLGVAVCDYDGDGFPDVAIVNDLAPGDLMHNNGKGHFTNQGAASGLAYNTEGHMHSGMGIDWGDYDNDGRLDAIVTTFANEPKSLYHNEGIGVLTDVAPLSGLDGLRIPHVAWGVKFVDFDNDGWLDLLIANGHIQDNVQAVVPSRAYRNPTQAFRNLGGMAKPVQFADISAQTGEALARPIVGRGLAVGDYDNDGRMDAIVVDSEGRPLLLHNETEQAGHWLGVRLIGTKSNRDGYGALLTVQAGGRALVRQCQSSGSYLSASDKRVPFGLGTSLTVEKLTVRWPSGLIETYHDIAADQYITLHEGIGSKQFP